MDDEERRRLQARFRKLCADSGYPEKEHPGTSLRDRHPPTPKQPATDDGRSESLNPDEGYFSPSRLP